MAALDFPATPTDGQLFAAPNGVTYQYSTSKGLWLATPAPLQYPVGDFYVAYVSGTDFAIGASPVTVIFNSVLCGNAGSYYNPANGRYTPPAGRYRLFAGVTFFANASNSSATLSLRKNGTIIGPQPNGYSTGTNWAQVVIDEIVDANGTDWFDIQILSNLASSGNKSWFGAVPVGIVTPMPPDGVLRLYSEQVCTGGETQMNVTIPASAKRIELEWIHQAASGDPNLTLQCVESGVLFTTANHNMQQTYSTGSTAGGFLDSAATGWRWGVNRTSSSTKFFRTPSGTTWNAVQTSALISAGGTRQAQVNELDGGANPATTTGFRLTLASSSFVAGSFLRAYVVS